MLNRVLLAVNMRSTNSIVWPNNDVNQQLVTKTRTVQYMLAAAQVQPLRHNHTDSN